MSRSDDPVLSPKDTWPMFELKFGKGADVIVTSYFTTKSNPQAQAGDARPFAPKNDISYIFPWYVSAQYHHLSAVVIHDGLSEDFIRQYEHPHLQFVYYAPDNYSLNDERFFALHKTLTVNELGRVLMTDGCDVLFKKNPFDYMTDSSLLYFGSDHSDLPKIRDNDWCLKKLALLLKSPMVAMDESIFDFQYVNVGVYGGDAELLKSFNQSLILLFRSLDNEDNNNMMAVNYLLWKLKPRFFAGQPFTSPFKKYDMSGDYVIIHK
jgi:hypothetical protein